MIRSIVIVLLVISVAFFIWYFTSNPETFSPCIKDHLRSEHPEYETEKYETEKYETEKYEAPEEKKTLLDFDDFRVKSKNAKLFFLSSPHSPTGRVWTKDELIQLADICMENDVIIVSDEIHNDLILPDNKHTPIASISDEIADITITCIAPSKTFNLAGMATSSLIISNQKLRDKMQSIINSLHVSLGNIFGAIASEAAYTHGYEWVAELMEYVSGNLTVLRDTLSSSNSCIKLVEPEATYMAWLDFNETGYDDDKIKNIIINQAKLGLSHGPIFGDGGSGFQRINLASPRTIVTNASDRLCKAFKR